MFSIGYLKIQFDVDGGGGGLMWKQFDFFKDAIWMSVKCIRYYLQVQFVNFFSNVTVKWLFTVTCWANTEKWLLSGYLKMQWVFRYRF